MDFENWRQRKAYEERQKKLKEMKARKKLVNYLRKNDLGLVEIHKLLVDCGYREENNFPKTFREAYGFENEGGL